MTDYDPNDPNDQGYDAQEDDGYSYDDDPGVRAINPPPPEEPQPVPNPQRRETVIPIGEAVTPETLHGVVAFTRSVNLGTRDNNAHFRCELPFVVQPQWTPGVAAAAAADSFYQCVAVVLQQAGLPFAVGEDGVLREVVKQFAGARQVGPVEEQPRQRDEVTDRRDRNGSSFPHPGDMRRPEHISEGLWSDLVETYPDDWYDNRGDKANGDAGESSPDFKRKDDGKGLWLRPFRKEGGRGGGGGSRGGNHARSGGGRRYED